MLKHNKTTSKEYSVPGLVGFTAWYGEPVDPSFKEGYYDMYHAFDRRGEGICVKFEVVSEGILKLSLDDWGKWLDEIGIQIEVWLDQAFADVMEDEELDEKEDGEGTQIYFAYAKDTVEAPTTPTVVDINKPTTNETLSDFHDKLFEANRPKSLF